MPMIWHPAADPWQGSYLQGIEIVETLAHASAPGQEIMLCSRRKLVPGERIDIMLSGRDTVLYDLVVPDPWPAGLPHTTLDCEDTVTGGHLLIPDACGNPSWVFAPNPLPTPFPTWFPGVPPFEASEWLPGPWFTSGEFIAGELPGAEESAVVIGETPETNSIGSSPTVPIPAPSSLSLLLAALGLGWLLGKVRKA